MVMASGACKKIVACFLAAVFLPTIFVVPARAEDADVSAIVETTLGVTTSVANVTLNLNPTNHDFDYGDLDVYVTTNSPAGYKMTMNSTSTNLVETHDNTKTIETLPTLAGGYTDATFVANKWGYKVGTSGNYMAFESGVEVANKGTLANNDTTTFRLAGKVDYDQAPGNYTMTLVFAAVANLVPVYMQNLKSSMCTEAPLAVIDKRDGEEYLVQRLADGNCWMLDNLRLDPTAVSLETLQGNTNATDESLTYFKNGGGSSPYSASGVSSSWSSSSQNSYNLPYINASYKNTVESVTYGSGSGKVGVYYNYCAASAGSYCYAENASTGDAAYDICPKNWRLPVGGATTDATNEFNNLYLSYSSNPTILKTALSTPLSGVFYSGAARNRGSDGYFWSSTLYNTNSMRLLYLRSANVNSDTAYYRLYGLSVRCILK